MANIGRVKTFMMDPETEERLVKLADNDERSQAAEVRHLINVEYERRLARRRVRREAAS